MEALASGEGSSQEAALLLLQTVAPVLARHVSAILPPLLATADDSSNEVGSRGLSKGPSTPGPKVSLCSLTPSHCSALSRALIRLAAMEAYGLWLRAEPGLHRCMLWCFIKAR